MPDKSPSSNSSSTYELFLGPSSTLVEEAEYKSERFDYGNRIIVNSLKQWEGRGGHPWKKFGVLNTKLVVQDGGVGSGDSVK